MRILRLALIFGILLASTAALTPPAAGSTTVERYKTVGYAFASFGDCPDSTDTPPPGTVCHDASLTLAREAVAIGGGGLSTKDTPWSAFLYEATLTFDASGDAVQSDVRSGFVPEIDAAAVTYDRQHLTFASVRTDIPMSDGSTSSVDVAWVSTSDRMVFGNDGPALADFGLVRHSVDGCSTQNNQAHQKFRIAAMTGAIDGAPVHTYTAFPAGYISFNHFVFIDATHGKICGGP